jgi:pimeloyl-ACP methyl ester carboxylesterase
VTAVRRRILSVFAAVTLAGGLLAAPSAGAHDDVPGDQPLPGYTISNPPLPPATVDGRQTRVIQGVREHAAYIIEVPPRWNGQLAMWAHGYRGPSRVLTVEPPAFGLRQRMLSQGYAWAASSYYANDYDVRAGVLSTRDLADHFARTVRKPRKTFLVGVSMGGHITARSLEQYPGFYDAGLPMCGVLGDHALFDYFLDFNVVAQDLADQPAYPAPPNYLTEIVPRIWARLGLTGLAPGGPDTTNDLGKQFRSIVINRSGGPRPGAEQAFAYWYAFLFRQTAPTNTGETLAEDPGRISTNVFTWYRPNSPVNVNASVLRVAPRDRVSRLTHRLTQIPKISGRPNVPVLSLHNLGDLFVPFSMEQHYAADTARTGHSRNVVQRAIRAIGHCEFSPGEAGTAWDDLVRWERTGRRPAGDNVTHPKVVSSPNYGCRFSDPAAYVPGGTRQLFAPCP